MDLSTSDQPKTDELPQSSIEPEMIRQYLFALNMKLEEVSRRLAKIENSIRQIEESQKKGLPITVNLAWQKP